MTNKLTEIDSKFYQESNIIPLSTKTNTGLQRCGKSEWWDGGADKLIDDRWEWQHLDFISNEEIKEGDWVLRGNGSYGCRKVLRIHKDFAICTDFWDKPIETSFPLNELKKIIATTDKGLEKHCNTCQGKKEIFNGLFQVDCPDCYYKTHNMQLPRPSNEFLSKFCKLGGIDKVLVEMEEINFDASVFGGKSEILSIPFLQQIKVASDNTITCKPVQEEKKTWNKAEVEVLCRNAFMRKDVGKGLPFDYTDTSCDKWIKENLK